MRHNWYMSFREKAKFLPVLEISVLIAHAQNRSLNRYEQLASEARGLRYCLSLNVRPYIACAISESSGETARIPNLA